MPSKAETLLLSYQTIPRTPRTLPAHPAPPQTRTARLLRAQAMGQQLVVDGQAVRPKDLFFRRGAGPQAVAGAAGAAGRVYGGR